MIAVILAAGKSTRMHPLTTTIPKPLINICNKSILEHNLESLIDIVDEIFIITNYKELMIKKKLKNYSSKIRFFTQKQVDGTGSALLTVQKHLKNRFIVLNGDDIYSKKDIKACLKHEHCILIKELKHNLCDFGSVTVDGVKVTSILEKDEKKRAGFAYTGLLVSNSILFNINLKKSKRKEYEITDFVSYLIKKHHLQYVKVSDYWMNLTYPWDVLNVTSHFTTKTKCTLNGKIEPNATLKGEVFVGKGTVIKNGSYVEGPVIIGQDCSIGPNCFIRSGTVIGDRSRIGNACEIKNSVIGNDTSISHLSYVGDSVIGNNVNFGAGTITANVRHDKTSISTMVGKELIDTNHTKFGVVSGDNVKTGINTIIYPGRKIWNDKTTLPGAIVKNDII